MDDCTSNPQHPPGETVLDAKGPEPPTSPAAGPAQEFDLAGAWQPRPVPDWSLTADPDFIPGQEESSYGVSEIDRAQLATSSESGEPAAPPLEAEPTASPEAAPRNEPRDDFPSGEPLPGGRFADR